MSQFPHLWKGEEEDDDNDRGAAWDWDKINRQKFQNWESRNRLSHTWYFIHDKYVYVKKWGKGGFSYNGNGSIRYPSVKILILTPISEHTNQFQVDYMLNVKDKTVKLWEDYIGDYPRDFGGRQKTLKTWKGLTIKEKINKLNYIELWTSVYPKTLFRQWKSKSWTGSSCNT